MKTFVFKKQFSFFSLLSIIIFCSAITYMYTQFKINKIADENTLLPSNQNNTTGIKVRDNSTYKYAKPMLYDDTRGKDPKLNTLVTKINDEITTLKNSDELSDASIYFRDLSNGDWTGLNDNETFQPGSLIKVPMLMYYLKQSESNPQLLNTKLTLTPEMIANVPHQTFNSEYIKPNQAYTIKELLYQMGANSDNYATLLLNLNCDLYKFDSMFNEFKLAIPNMHDANYGISAKDYSVFMRILFNSSYLSPKNSDEALKILADCKFNEGIAKTLPSNILLAHKFGEVIQPSQVQLHESGIIYCNSHPFLLTIMTKGKDSKQLAKDISIISEMVFKSVCI